jgi:transposase
MSERHSMRKVREVLRLEHELGLSDRKIATSVGIAHSTVSDYLARAKRAGLTWEEAKGLSDAEVEGRLFQRVGQNEPATRAPVDFNRVHMELRRAGVTRRLLWSEYAEQVACGGSGCRPYQYSQFCELYEAHRSKLEPSMRQVHRAGEKAFLDYSGVKLRIFDPKTGAATEVELFVMVLGASNYTYAEATRTQRLADFVGSTVRGLEYFGGVPELLVPDQLRSAVKTPDRIEPEINETYAEMAQHYGTAVVPARPRKPKDKAKAEGGVLVVQRWIVACLRNRRFFSLEELNAAIWELLEKLNTRPFQKLEGCRRSAFEKLDRPALRPLPVHRYELGEWKLGVGVNIDYHLEYDARMYSVPCALIEAKVDVRATATTVEVRHGGVQVALHARSYGPRGTAVTNPAHRPLSHQQWGNWPPERLVGWAAQTGPKTAEVVEAILERRTHPETGRRACLGLMRMVEKYGTARVEAACGRALAIQSPTYKSVDAILKAGLDKVALKAEVEAKVVIHENIRGGAYYDREEVKAAGHGDEIEARYLEEERFAIMNESSFAPAPEVSESSRAVQRREVSGAVAASTVSQVSHGRATEPITVLLGRLQALWARPPVVLQSRHRGADERGGDDSRESMCESSSCMSLVDCTSPAKSNREKHPFEEEKRKRDGVVDEMTCVSDDGWDDVPGPCQGEVR